MSRSRCLRSGKLSFRLRTPRSTCLRELLERGVSLPEGSSSTCLETPERVTRRVSAEHLERCVRPTTCNLRFQREQSRSKAVTPTRCRYETDRRRREHGVSRRRAHFDPSQTPSVRRVFPHDEPLGRASDAPSPLVRLRESPRRHALGRDRDDTGPRERAWLAFDPKRRSDPDDRARTKENLRSSEPELETCARLRDLPPPFASRGALASGPFVASRSRPKPTGRGDVRRHRKC